MSLIGRWVFILCGVRERVLAHQLEGKNANVAGGENHNSTSDETPFIGLSCSTTNPLYSSMGKRQDMLFDMFENYETELNHKLATSSMGRWEGREEEGETS